MNQKDEIGAHHRDCTKYDVGICFATELISRILLGFNQVKQECPNIYQVEDNHQID